MADNEFKTNVDSLFSGMDQFISSKTVVGEAIHLGDTIILPLVDVTFGVGAGAGNNTQKGSGSGAGGIGGKMTPTAVLVISNGTTKMVNVKGQDSLSKLLDLIPDVVNRFTNAGKTSAVEEEIPEE